MKMSTFSSLLLSVCFLGSGVLSTQVYAKGNEKKVKVTQKVVTEEMMQTILENSKGYATQGAVADYIPELGKQDPTAISFSVVTKQGKVINVGDTSKKFTMQSIAKVVALMVALQENGEQKLFQHMGYYGSERPFNHFANLETMHEPLNPLMNAGAIYTTASISGEGEEAFLKILDMVRYITKNDEINYNVAVYESEKETGHRNRGMFHIMKNFEIIEGEENKLDNYFKECSIEVSAEDLAKIGYFFANHCVRFDGDNRYEDKDMARLIQSQMLVAGMYDFSGEYARQVGLPSKSGVGGGIIVSVPQKMGIGTFSAPLDKQGNSVAGYHMIFELAKQLDLGLFN